MQFFEYSPILGWSNSRYDKFTICRRQYYYQYYYKQDSEYPQVLIARLRSMISVPLQIGIIAHTCISTLPKRLLKEPSQPIDTQHLNDYIRRKVVEQYGKAEYTEIYYCSETQINMEQINNKVLIAIMNLIESDRFKWLTQQALVATESWLIGPEGYGETRVGGLKAYCKVDFLIPVQDHLYIFDWKTGKERQDKHNAQMRGYAAWASYHYDISLDAIIPMIAYLLPEYHEKTVEFNESDMQDFATLVRGQIREMYALCSNVDENVPLSRDRFPQAKVESLCEYCNFIELRGHTQIGSANAHSIQINFPDLSYVFSI